MRRSTWLILFVAWLGWVFDIMDTALFNFAKVPMLTEFLGGPDGYKAHGLTIEGRLQMVFLVGWAVGGLLFGVLADRWGRSRTMIATILIYCAFTGLTALCHSPEQVAVARFLTALGIGGEWAAGAALVAESVPNEMRARAAAFLQSAAAVGPAIAALVNLAIPAANWRWLFAVGIAPALVTVVIRSYIKEPEQPRTTEPFFTPLKELFSNPLTCRYALVALGIGFVGIAGAQNVSYWLPNLVKTVSTTLTPDELKDRMSQITWVFHIGTLVGVFAVPLLCDRFGRKATIFTFFILSPIAIYGATQGATDYGRLLLLAPLLSLFAIGVSAAFGLYFPELFPRRVRATGAGFAYNTGRILTAGTPIYTAFLATSLGGNILRAVLLTSATLLVIAIIALPFAPETKGKPLPD